MKCSTNQLPGFALRMLPHETRSESSEHKGHTFVCPEQARLTATKDGPRKQ